MHQGHVVTKLIHDNFSLIMAFAYSRASLAKTLDSWFAGEWEFLRKSCFDLAEERADRALLEMATQLRILDSRDKIADYLKKTEGNSLGSVTQGDGSVTVLYYRDATNKIIHASQFEWACLDVEKPIVICHSDEPKRWQRAEIDLLALAGLCGGLIF